MVLDADGIPLRAVTMRIFGGTADFGIAALRPGTVDIHPGVPVAQGFSESHIGGEGSATGVVGVGGAAPIEGIKVCPQVISTSLS